MQLEVTSIAPYVVIMVGLMLLGRLLGASPLAPQLPNAGRFKSLDGVRGFLALAVFFHHAVARYYYELNGVWEYPKGSAFYTISPQAAVAIFFMITGFLFWSKVIKAHGRLNWWRLFASRARRLVPAYVVSIAVLCLVIGFATAWRLQVPPVDLFKQILRWLSFSFLTLPDLNGFKDTWTVQGVIWTLRFEWAFIFALPVVALLYRPWRFALLFVACLCLWTYTSRLVIMCNFLFGMLAAYSPQFPRLSAVLRRREAAVAALLALFWVYAGFPDTQGIPQIALMFLFFLVIVNGNDMFGVLSLRGSQYLGAISYSLYLLHGMMLFAGFAVYRQLFGPVSDPWTFWALVAVTGIATTLLSALTYRFVEEPFMRGVQGHSGQTLTATTA